MVWPIGLTFPVSCISLLSEVEIMTVVFSCHGGRWSKRVNYSYLTTEDLEKLPIAKYSCNRKKERLVLWLALVFILFFIKSAVWLWRFLFCVYCMFLDGSFNNYSIFFITHWQFFQLPFSLSLLIYIFSMLSLELFHMPLFSNMFMFHESWIQFYSF